MREPLLALAGAAAVVAFVTAALPRAEGVEAGFAVALLMLVGGATVGACAFDLREGERRWQPAARAVRRSGWLAAAAIAAGVAFGTAAIAVGLFAGLFAFACGAVAHALGGGVARVAVACVACLLLATLFYWDGAFLLEAADRKRSAALAFDLNPAAAASITLGFDWIHSKGLYSNNETAESLVGVDLRGVGPYSLRLGAVAAVAAVAGLWRKP